MDGSINPKIDKCENFFGCHLQAIYKKKQRPYPLSFYYYYYSFYLFPTTRNHPAAPTTNASCKMDDLMMTLCVCVCVSVEKDKIHFSVCFSHPKAKLTIVVVSLAKLSAHPAVQALCNLNTPRVAWNIPLEPYAHDMQTFHHFEF
jgi:hypothetical protein